jgi:hypothetical protein
MRTFAVTPISHQGETRVTSYRIVIAAFAAATLAAGAATAQAPAAAPAAKAPAAPRAEPPAPQRSPLAWKEVWKQNPAGAEGPINLTSSVSNPELELKLYGPGASLNILGKDADDNNPPHVFSGEAKGPMAFAFRDKKGPVDLTGLSRIRVNTKMSGLHKVYPIVKLASGDWYMADKAAGASTKDWVMEEIPFSDVRWYKLDIAGVVTKGNPVDKIDLSKVDEIGFADIIPASGHGPGGWFDVGQIEVYGKSAAK